MASVKLSAPRPAFKAPQDKASISRLLRRADNVANSIDDVVSDCESWSADLDTKREEIERLVEEYLKLRMKKTGDYQKFLKKLRALLRDVEAAIT